MVLGYHLIISAYGFWLPNDPRGSGSDVVRSGKLLVFGEATKVDAHQCVSRKPHDRKKRLAAKKALNRPPVIFTGLQARAVARGFGRCSEKTAATVWACAVMPDHAHLVVARHEHDIEVLGNLFKGEATKQLVREKIHPFQGQKGEKNRVPTCFGRKWWAIFLDTEDEVLRTIRYVENNPVKAGFRQQKWRFVLPYPERYQKPKGGV